MTARRVSEHGQTMVEYCLVLALIIGILVLAFPALTGAVSAAVEGVASALDAVL